MRRAGLSRARSKAGAAGLVAGFGLGAGVCEKAGRVERRSARVTRLERCMVESASEILVGDWD